MGGFVVGFVLVAVLAAGGAFAWSKWRRGDWPLPQFVEERIPALAPATPESHAPKIIWLVRGGVTLRPGVDDSQRRVSSVVASAKGDKAGKAEIVVPRFIGGDAVWKRFVACVSAQFARFDVVVTDQEPATGGYVLVAVGGKPSLIGFPPQTGGLAPFRAGEIVENPVVFVFSETLRHRVQPMCDTAAMEIAHTYGLDHAYLCKDPMSYLTGCGAKTFQDIDAPCGEHEIRTCSDGAATQNSVRVLGEVLGFKEGKAPTGPPKPAPPPPKPTGAKKTTTSAGETVPHDDGHDHGSHAH